MAIQMLSPQFQVIITLLMTKLKTLLEQKKVQGKPRSTKNKVFQAWSKKSVRRFVMNRLLKKLHEQKPSDVITIGNAKCLMRESDFSCPICLSITVHPIFLGCGHLYCLDCIEKAQQKYPNCSVCRAPQEYNDHEVCRSMEDLIEEVVVPESEQSSAYIKRKQVFEEEEKKRNIGENAFLNQPVDYLDKLGEWKVGTIDSMKIDKFKDVLLTIHPLGWNGDKGLEIVTSSKSRRVAQLHYFTKKQGFKKIVGPQERLGRERSLPFATYEQLYRPDVLLEPFFRDEPQEMNWYHRMFRDAGFMEIPSYQEAGLWNFGI